MALPRFNWGRYRPPAEVAVEFSEGEPVDRAHTPLSRVSWLTNGTPAGVTDAYWDNGGAGAISQVAPAKIGYMTTQDWAVSFWFNRQSGVGSWGGFVCDWEGTTTTPTFLIAEKTGNDQLALWTNPGVGGAQSRARGPVDLDTGVWHFVVANYDASAGYPEVFLDNVAGATTVVGGGTGSPTPEAIVLGALYASATLPADVQLAKIAYWDHQLTASERARMLQEGRYA